MPLIYIDSGVLIAAILGQEELARKAMEVLDDPDQRFASSFMVRLEVLPKAHYFKNSKEAAFYEAYFEQVSAWAPLSQELAEKAEAEAIRWGLSAQDCLHVAAAQLLGAEELVTTEKPSKPLHRIESLKVRSIQPVGLS